MINTKDTSMCVHVDGVLSHSFIVHLSHPYMTTGKTIALTRQTFVGKGKEAQKISDLHHESYLEALFEI